MKKYVKKRKGETENLVEDNNDEQQLSTRMGVIRLSSVVQAHVSSQ